MKATKEFPQEYLYQGQINYFKIAKNPNFIRKDNLRRITKKKNG